jgi:hypothetical protein
MTLYQQIRAAGRSMHEKVIATANNPHFNLGRAAKRMTIPVLGRIIQPDDETAQNAFLDFVFSEYRVDGKTIAEMADPTAAQLTPLEAESLEAVRCSRTSLFETGDVLRKSNQIVIRDLLEPERPETPLTDLGMSASRHRSGTSTALYCRVVTIRGINMTSGFSFTFAVEFIPGLLQAYRQKMKKVASKDLSEQRFIFFFQKHRQIGSPKMYQDVV